MTSLNTINPPIASVCAHRTDKAVQRPSRDDKCCYVPRASLDKLAANPLDSVPQTFP